MDVAEENMMKNLYLFWTTDLEGTVSLETIEVLASMTQRYPVVCRELSVMMGVLFGMQGWEERQEEVFPESTKVVIKMWRAHMVEFDGALMGVGVRLFRIDPEGVVGETVFACGVGLTTDFTCGFKGDSLYQNAMELLAFAVWLGAVVKLGGRGLRCG